MKTLIIGISISALLFVGCSEKKSKDDAQAIYAESMKIHDAIMPRMDEIYRLQEKLKAKRDSLRADSVSNHAQIKTLEDALVALKQADRGMMDWMHNIQDVPGNTADAHAGHGHQANTAAATSEEQTIEIQKKQKAAIERIQAEFESSIQTAKALVASPH